MSIKVCRISRRAHKTRTYTIKSKIVCHGQQQHYIAHAQYCQTFLLLLLNFLLNKTLPNLWFGKKKKNVAKTTTKPPTRLTKKMGFVDKKTREIHHLLYETRQAIAIVVFRDYFDGFATQKQLPISAGQNKISTATIDKSGRLCVW